jgi:8-oxo-dGTP pyrophosphatase MutT (NUDIX family)
VSDKNDARVQYAALPYRRNNDRTLDVLLITSRETRRWVIPKGWPVADLPPNESAAHEAMEEAGVIGSISKKPIGSYPYEKRLSDGSTVRCRVRVFALDVEKQFPSWREQDQRRRKWFEAHQAVDAVEEPELRAIIRRLTSRPA